MKRQLTEREQEAVNWAKANYPHWRKRWNKTLEQHMAAIPAWMALSDHYPEESRRKKRELWESWYHFPFGVPEWNDHVAIVRQLLLERLV